MAFESVRGYVQLATGLGDLTRARATEAAQGLLSLPGQAAGSGTARVAGQVSSLADELLAAATTNRENLLALVRSEIDAAVLRLGLARASELEAALERVSVLRSQVAELRATAAFAAAEEARGVAPESGAEPARRRASSAATKTTAKKPTTKKTATKATAKEAAVARPAASTATAKKSAAKKAAAAKTTAKKSAAKKTAAKKATAAKATAKKSAAKKTTAKKTAPAASRRRS